MSEMFFCDKHAVGMIPSGCPLCRVAELEATLTKLARYDEGDDFSAMDEPYAARVARAVLAKKEGSRG